MGKRSVRQSLTLLPRLLEGKGQVVPDLARKPDRAWDGCQVCEDVAEVLMCRLVRFGLVYRLFLLFSFLIPC